MTVNKTYNLVTVSIKKKRMWLTFCIHVLLSTTANYSFLVTPPDVSYYVAGCIKYLLTEGTLVRNLLVNSVVLRKVGLSLETPTTPLTLVGLSFPVDNKMLLQSSHGGKCFSANTTLTSSRVFKWRWLRADIL